MKYIKLIFLVSLIFGCSASRRKERDLFYGRVAEHKTELLSAYTHDDEIYLEYLGRTLSADVSDDKKDASTLLSPASPPRQTKRENINIYSNEWGRAFQNTMDAIAPTGPAQAALVNAANHELILFKGPDGATEFKDLKELPPGMRVVKKVEEGEFWARIFKEFFALTPPEARARKFLLPLEDLPLNPFIYVDLDRSFVTSLSLPVYYENKSDKNTIGFSLDFIYNFFIKSHAFNLVKAPATSVYRLLARTENAVGATFTYKLEKPAPPEIAPAPRAENFDIASFNEWLDRNVNTDNYTAEMEFYIGGEEFFTDFIIAAREAKESIFTHVYLFNNDPYGIEIADMFKELSARLDVRVLADNMGTVLNENKAMGKNETPGFVVNQNIVKYLRKNSSVAVRTHPNVWATFDHNKVYIIDRKKAYVGGMNIGDEYRYKWHDIMFSLSGPAVDKLLNVFYENWSYAGWTGDAGVAARKLSSKKNRPHNAHKDGMINVRLLRTKPLEPEIYMAQLEAIKRAKNRIYIENPYFANNRIVNELAAARRRGVDVRVILPGDNNISLMSKNNIIMANHLLENGIKVYMYNGMTHAKAALFDNWACVGSANLDRFSLFINKESDFAFSDEKTVEELNRRLFQKDFEDSRLLEEPLKTSWTDHILKFLAGRF